MKTKVGEAMAAPRQPLCLSLPSGNGRHFPCVGGWLLRCVGGGGGGRGSCTDRWDVEARISRLWLDSHSPGVFVDDLR